MPSNRNDRASASIDNLADLRIFTRIVATGSLSQAGRELNLSLAVVSKRPAALEDRLGVGLINRTTRRLNATQEGLEFFERCQRILADLEEAEAAVTTGREQPKGLVKVTAAIAFGRRRVAPALVEFCRRHPEVAVELELADRTVDLVDSGIDVAIRAGALQDSSLIARKLVGNTGSWWHRPTISPATARPRRRTICAGTMAGQLPKRSGTGGRSCIHLVRRAAGKIQTMPVTR